MENINFLENLATRLGQTATVRNVYGEPVIAEGKTIIPVAQIAYGFGGGYGLKPKKKFTGQNASAEIINEKEKTGEGLGGGGGMFARPKGVYEISKQGTRFIPANNLNLLMVAALTGFIIRGMFQRRKK